MNNNCDEMRDDYSAIFANQIPVRGKYYERVMREKHLVQLDDDVLSAFTSAKDVNAALRGVMDMSRYVHAGFEPQRMAA